MKHKIIIFYKYIALAYEVKSFFDTLISFNIIILNKTIKSVANLVILLLDDDFSFSLRNKNMLRLQNDVITFI